MVSKGIASPVYNLLTLLTGVAFAILGGTLSFKYLDRLILTVTGVGLAQTVTHAIHDLELKGERTTFSDRTLKAFIVLGFIILGIIAIYLAYFAGWFVLVLAFIGFISCFYGKIHEHIMFGFAGFFVTLGSSFVQTSTVSYKSLALSLFAFFLWFGGIHIYKLNDWIEERKSLEEEKNKGLIIICLGIIPLIMTFLVA